MTVLVTPSVIQSGSNKLAPAIFVFMYDLILERNFSLQSLNVLFLSLPASSIIAWVILKIKRKFF